MLTPKASFAPAAAVPKWGPGSREPPHTQNPSFSASSCGSFSMMDDLGASSSPISTYLDDATEQEMREKLDQEMQEKLDQLKAESLKYKTENEKLRQEKVDYQNKLKASLDREESSIKREEIQREYLFKTHEVLLEAQSKSNNLVEKTAEMVSEHRSQTSDLVGAVLKSNEMVRKRANLGVMPGMIIPPPPKKGSGDNRQVQKTVQKKPSARAKQAASQAAPPVAPPRKDRVRSEYALRRLPYRESKYR
eukprot:gnl/MRDRNA2_/MRDRNA2_81537_c1_seq1.p1 gnl/MRDRNA2_/MRDRNA2_81537_c1~~gnl/MRDRNA2_/MRDRNA2_81537_c1_seq1.p1  ORF type:complete len:249 (+),score=53.67 gnl/MRDRNA2_/MRDRNA2_81537_c1_seq1:90-836(+)